MKDADSQAAVFQFLGDPLYRNVVSVHRVSRSVNADARQPILIERSSSVLMRGGVDKWRGAAR